MMYPNHHEFSCFFCPSTYMPGQFSVTISHPMFSDSLCKVSHLSRHQITLEFDSAYISSRNTSLCSVNLLTHSFWSLQVSYNCLHVLDKWDWNASVMHSVVIFSLSQTMWWWYLLSHFSFTCFWIRSFSMTCCSFNHTRYSCCSLVQEPNILMCNCIKFSVLSLNLHGYMTHLASHCSLV